ncbi:hypothetical protein [Flavobacterium rhizosphaerae]|uniref:Uncharacterized protein n=1 Tax=Flavobacterium rhizosphaerae TaxID=3163298 RepID=A0ABW8YYW2_9FLAO
MNSNHIVVKNINEDDLQNILMNIANLYSDTEYVDGIQLYREKQKYDSFLILFTNQPDFERFNYFTNYIKYPEGYENLSHSVRGFFKVSDVRKQYDFNVGEWLMVYVSKNDKEYDNVNIVNCENKTYLFDFGGKIKKLNVIEESYKLIPIDINSFHHIIDIIPGKVAGRMETKPWWKFW